MRLITEIFLILSAVFPLVVLWRGPTLWDRLCGASSLNVRIALVLAAHAAFSGHELLLDVALAYAILGFLGTVLVARFGERSEM
ncbi:MAG: monovalent cation/H+ antiporter complex subunit F [Candidatus Bipolaricaulota bacterium]|nr:monovalent cation/H+ antiporter complex subunit F [Candidatus Bipolaricaulota bacterium]MDW8126563.1 monovalent cation/H+ antiporter complex subunit F [Candidatus Bipolaricaulota bacterium]